MGVDSTRCLLPCNVWDELKRFEDAAQEKLEYCEIYGTFGILWKFLGVIFPLSFTKFSDLLDP